MLVFWDGGTCVCVVGILSRGDVAGVSSVDIFRGVCDRCVWWWCLGTVV